MSKTVTKAYVPIQDTSKVLAKVDSTKVAKALGAEEVDPKALRQEVFGNRKT